VYFAGHGIHYSGHDYLMPVDLNMKSDYSIRDLVDGNEIIARIQQRNPKLLVVLLDMCRTIPQQGINLRIADELQRQIPRDSRSNLVMAWATAENSFAFEVRLYCSLSNFLMIFFFLLLTTFNILFMQFIYLTDGLRGKRNIYDVLEKIYGKSQHIAY
jgi:hypothetical protein